MTRLESFSIGDGRGGRGRALLYPTMCVMRGQENTLGEETGGGRWLFFAGTEH